MTEQPDKPSNEARTDWLRLGLVGVAAVVLSLIGFSVASRYQPAANSAQPAAGSAPETSTSSTTSTTEGSSAPLSSAESTSTTQRSSEPASLVMSPEVLDFGAETASIELEIVNDGGVATGWNLTSPSPGVGVNPAEGQIGPGETVVVAVSLDRSEATEGEFETTLALSWPDGEATAGVVAAFQDNPVIHNPSASPPTVQVAATSDCSPTRTTVSARVRDTSDIDRVIARWSHDGSATRETAMSPVGDDIYEAVIGPYEVVGSDSVKVVAFDEFGNAGGASISVAVVDCS